MNDVSDHLPVFAILHGSNLRIHDTPTVIICRHKSLKAIESLKEELKIQDWNSVYVNETNEAYDSFLTILTKLYDKHCPLTQRVIQK